MITCVLTICCIWSLGIRTCDVCVNSNYLPFLVSDFVSQILSSYQDWWWVVWLKYSKLFSLGAMGYRSSKQFICCKFVIHSNIAVSIIIFGAVAMLWEFILILQSNALQFNYNNALRLVIIVRLASYIC